MGLRGELIDIIITDAVPGEILMVRAGLEPGMLNQYSDSNLQSHELAPILNLMAHAVLPLKN